MTTILIALWIACLTISVVSECLAFLFFSGTVGDYFRARWRTFETKREHYTSNIGYWAAMLTVAMIVVMTGLWIAIYLSYGGNY
ncbi:hypothetical protein [Aestuariivirga sp.]|uniref:hypothetical protein n=1 Tax=Aestuariivirga sp. TaxID=2650926 RepID=UPI0039E29A1E